MTRNLGGSQTLRKRHMNEQSARCTREASMLGMQRISSSLPKWACRQHWLCQWPVSITFVSTSSCCLGPVCVAFFFSFYNWDTFWEKIQLPSQCKITEARSRSKNANRTNQFSSDGGLNVMGINQPKSGGERTESLLLLWRGSGWVWGLLPWHHSIKPSTSYLKTCSGYNLFVFRLWQLYWFIAPRFIEYMWKWKSWA